MESSLMRCDGTEHGEGRGVRAELLLYGEVVRDRTKGPLRRTVADTLWGVYGQPSLGQRCGVL